MIIKQTRVKVGGAQKLVAHITNTAQNDAVMILKGHLGIPADGDLIAEMHNRTYGNRHVIISPQVTLTEAARFCSDVNFSRVECRGCIKRCLSSHST
jgi:hypothetical protein